MKLIVKTLSALEKVFLDEEPLRTSTAHSALLNESSAFQIAYCVQPEQQDTNYGGSVELALEIESPVKEYLRVRRIDHVPVRTARFAASDEDYLREGPGLFPDILRPLPSHGLRACMGQWDSLWIDFEPEGNVPAGEYPVSIKIYAPVEGGEPLVSAQAEYTISLIGASLPEQKLYHTKWFHSDCLADYYNVPVFSEEYWQIVENFMAAAVKRSINMILTPIHTPPLDTRVGGERPTVQLVDIFCNGGKWSFTFEKLDRWVEIAKRVGVRYYEIAHIFTQWGAKYAPKIMATVDGEYKRVFGWETDGVGEEYSAFLREYVPAVCAHMKELGVLENCLFHVSDEPSIDHLEGYIKAKNILKPLIGDCPIIDALSNYEFYRTGAVERPVPAVNHIEPFIENNTPHLWSYYCISQHKDVANVFIGMPSYRNRIYAEQLYKYNIEGILQWGYNFYYARYSDYPVNPFMDPDWDGYSLAGDTFQVYPGPKGEPWESIRMMVSMHAVQDLRAFELLESLAGRDEVLRLIEGDLPEEEKITFSAYPRRADYILSLREKVNEEIAKRI